MVEKKRLTQEMLDKGFDEVGEFLPPVPYSVLEEAALEFMNVAFINDKSGVVYANYTYDIEWCYIVLKYLTNIDVEGISKEDLYLFAGVTIEETEDDVNIRRLSLMVYRMEHIITSITERENSLDYKLGMLVDRMIVEREFGSLDGMNKILSFVDKANREEDDKPVLKMFAKKE